LWRFPYFSPQQRAERQKDASGRGSMSAKDCHVKIAIFFFTTFPLAVFVFDVVLYGLPLIFVFLHLLYGFLMYLVVEIVVRKRGFDCDTPGWGAAYGFVFYILFFRDFSWFGFGYVILTTAMVLLPLFVLRPNQSGDDPRQQ
jgi:uncharacterized membrane protein YhaH (DUF805 family)